MNENASKLEAIRKEIEECSQCEAKAIVDNAESGSAEKIAELERKIFSESESNLRNITEKFRADEKKRVSEIRFSESKRVLIHRKEKVTEFFDLVEKKLSESLSDEKHTAYIKNSVEDVSRIYPLTGDTVVLCLEKDLKLVNNALAGYNFKTETTSDIKIGGVILSYPEKNLIIDLTLDAALEKEREAFTASAEMQL